MDYNYFKKIMRQSQVLRMPKSNISTFDKTCFKYCYLSRYQKHKNKTCVRKGNIMVHKPLIMLPEYFHHMVNGFDQEEASDFADKILGSPKKGIRTLGYRFKHTCEHTSIQLRPIEAIAMKMFMDMKDQPERIIVTGHEDFWEICLLKFLFKIVERSFKVNFEELEERGFLDPRGIPPKVYEEIETLFQKAKNDKKVIKELGALLLDKELFEDYEEQFFNLMK